MVIQASIQKCVCDRDITFPDGQVKAVCQNKYCKATWSIGVEGFWAITSVPFAPSYGKMKERNKERYESMMKRRAVKK